MGERRLMIKTIRPELKHLRQIVSLSKDVYGNNSPDHALHDFFKSVLVNLSSFFEIVEKDGVVKGVVTAGIHKQLWDGQIICQVGLIAGKDGYDTHLETIKNNLITWAKENKANKVIFVTLDKNDSIEGMPKEFKNIGTMYGVEL